MPKFWILQVLLRAMIARPSYIRASSSIRSINAVLINLRETSNKTYINIIIIIHSNEENFPTFHCDKETEIC